MRVVSTLPNFSVESYGVHYPSISVKDAATGALQIGGSYQDSVDIGTSDIETGLARKDMDCPAERFVLVGYSQGAEAVNHALNGVVPSLRDKIDAVILFGDPEFDPSDTAADYSDFDSGYSGIMGPHNQGVPWSRIMTVPVYDYCHLGDIICDSVRQDGARGVEDLDLGRIASITSSQGLRVWGDHDNYLERGDVAAAVNQLVALLQSPPL